jgi:CRISPR-associated protein Csa3
MRTYISPIGYDTRRVTQPVINTGLGEDDRIILLRPGEEADTERADQTIADVRQLLQKVEPNCAISVDRIRTDSFENTVRDCCRVLGDVDPDRETIVSLGGGARDVLLPLTIAALLYAVRIDRTLFYSDLDGSVREWTLPDLTAGVPERTLGTFEAIVEADGWLSLSEIEAETDQSKSTVIRHVATLEEKGVVDSETIDRAKRVRVTFTGELLSLARQATP